MRCQRPGCSAEITYAVNLKTMKHVPLVPYNPEFPKALRYILHEARSDGQRECTRAEQGAWMNHFADCKNPPGKRK